MCAPQLGGTGKINVGVVRHDAGAARQRSFAHRRRHNDTGRPGGGQLLLVARVAQETEVSWACNLQWRNPGDGALSSPSFEQTTERINNVPEKQAHASPSRTSLFGTGSSIQRLEDLVSDVMLGVDVDSLLQNHVVLFSFSHLFDDLVGALKNL